MQATGLTDAERKALGKKRDRGGAVRPAGRQRRPFVDIFGGQPGQPQGPGLQATLDQTLFLANGTLLRGWLAPRPAT